MSLDVAYSIEIDDFIDPDKAYELYWSGMLEDKRAFLCPGTNCSANVTCANLDKDTSSLKVVPHFRVFGSHTKGCEVSRNVPLKLQYAEPTTQTATHKTLDTSIVDTFLEKRPESYYDHYKTNSRAKNAKVRMVNILKSKAERQLKEIGVTSSIYSVRTVVSRYARYKKDGTLELRRLNIAGKDKPYTSLFSKIENQIVSDLPQMPSIYHGWAFINRLPSGHGYQIKFKKKLKGNSSDKEFTTTVMIGDRLIEHYKMKKLVAKRIEKLYKSPNPTAYVFIYGTPRVNERNGRYANIDITNLDMIDICLEDPWAK
ncbi:hypothetical protein [Vibrio parahaemolyticus]|uniref:hypothetical protein n=1 Tax=Vibrio parahaemolyticus TaxID=670 RepID=UPI001120BC90|nr:hypothetical protein [Vibrio parahaemolyticus]TOI27782.1 hypothetical protein CGI64_12030 [Vibrio parahaemolyticus]